MGFFQKIKQLFIKEDGPLPSSEEFISGDKKDIEKILDDLGLTKNEKTEQITPDVNNAESSQQTKREVPPSNISSLFFEEDEVDLNDLKEKSEIEARRHSSFKEDSGDSSSNAFREKLEENLKRAGDQILEKGEKVREKFDSFLDEVGKKSAELDELERKEKEKYSGPMDYRGKSLLDDKDDFFEKAKAFADGRPFPPDGIRIEKSDSTQPNKEDKRKVYGFDDLDGDGDEIIDDAIIDEQE